MNNITESDEYLIGYYEKTLKKEKEKYIKTNNNKARRKKDS